MPSRLGHGLYKKIIALKNIFRCIKIIIVVSTARVSEGFHLVCRIHDNCILINFKQYHYLPF